MLIDITKEDLEQIMKLFKMVKYACRRRAYT